MSPGASPIDDARIIRAVQWCQGSIDIGGMQVRLEGDDVPTRLHTLVALYALEEVSLVLDLTENQEVLGIGEVCRRLRGYELPRGKLGLQRKLWAQELSVVFPAELMWEAAIASTQLLGLPTAFCVFGNAIADGAPMTYMQVPLGAPLEMALDAFKLIVPRPR